METSLKQLIQIKNTISCVIKSPTVKKTLHRTYIIFSIPPFRYTNAVKNKASVCSEKKIVYPTEVLTRQTFTCWWRLPSEISLITIVQLHKPLAWCSKPIRFIFVKMKVILTVWTPLVLKTGGSHMKKWSS